ncbi:MAG: response regulator transcription factor [Lachnospiraceae bacterium]|nr:response regulator transcription factor [Lachnospiraceae bacterium]
MKIYICDDEIKILNDMQKRIRECRSEDEIKAFTSGMELINELEKDICDILLLDIDMPDISGMDVAEWLLKLERRPLLIFVTSHDELVYDSFQYHPFGFVRKSYFNDEISKVLKDAVKALGSNTKYFNFRTEGKDIRVLLSEIRYFEADGNYLKLFTTGEEYRFRSTVTAVENSLSNQGFIRIHKGFLVNQSGVRVLSNEEAHLIDGAILPMGKTYVDKARTQLMRYMRG